MSDTIYNILKKIASETSEIIETIELIRTYPVIQLEQMLLGSMQSYLGQSSVP